MNLSDFRFPFDLSLVAKHPIHPRDHARLMVVDRVHGHLTHRQVKDLPTILQAGDLLVVNDTKVLPARLRGTKVPSGGKIEMLFVKNVDVSHAEVLIQGRVGVGQVLKFPGEAQAKIVEKNQSRTVIQWLGPGRLLEYVHQYGELPLPPYLKRQPVVQDQKDYQTMFALKDGAVASPTAGLHFTPSLLQTLRDKGINMATITLHVGPGTFQPVKTERLEAHIMHSERFEVSADVAKQIREVQNHQGRVVAVGTTVARSLESAVNARGEIESRSGDTHLFILPGFQFRVVDVLMTNFHFPETTLLMLVSAFAGLETVRNAYAQAVHERYRLYSYGDAMLIQ